MDSHSSQGLSTGIGSAIAFFSRRTNTSMLSLALGLSAGVMIYISFVELYSTSMTKLTELYGDTLGQLYALLSFFGGILLIMVIDFLVPERENPHEMVDPNMIGKCITSPSHTAALARTGILSAIVIAIHNFPEGMVTLPHLSRGAIPRPTHSHRHSHTQYTRGNISLRTHLLRYRQQGKSILDLILQRSGRTLRCHHRIPNPPTIPLREPIRHPQCHHRRYHGLHLTRRTTASRREVRQAPPRHHRTHHRYAHHGPHPRSPLILSTP